MISGTSFNANAMPSLPFGASKQLNFSCDFLSLLSSYEKTNQRTDEYGGSLENRSRFVREVVADARDAVGETMGITLRLSLDEM